MLQEEEISQKRANLRVAVELTRKAFSTRNNRNRVEAAQKRERKKSHQVRLEKPTICYYSLGLSGGVLINEFSQVRFIPFSHTDNAAT